MIRPEVTEDTFDEVKILSKNISGSFEDSLVILIDEIKRTRKQKEKSVKQ